MWLGGIRPLIGMLCLVCLWQAVSRKRVLTGCGPVLSDYQYVIRRLECWYEKLSNDLFWLVRCGPGVLGAATDEEKLTRTARANCLRMLASMLRVLDIISSHC
jgi:hypothetical protein